MSDAARKHPGINLGETHGRTHDKAEVELFGFWVFMMSDVIVFGLLIATYVTMLGATADGPGPKDLFELSGAFVETLVLLASSFTFGMASMAMKYRKDRKRLLAWLGVTLVLGLAFLALELRDFASMIDKGGVPSRSGWLSAFWALVPLHGLHVSVASVWLVVLAIQVGLHGLDDEVKLGMLRLGLLWHFLDVVWVAIVSVVYLAGLA